MIVYSDELYHYGIPGMRWGHRKARTLYDSNVRNARSQLRDAKRERHQFVVASRRNKADSKVESRIMKRGLSGHAAKLADRYEKKGMSRRDAEIKAYRRDRRTKAAIGVASAAAAGTAAYIARKKHVQKQRYLAEAAARAKRDEAEVREFLEMSKMAKEAWSSNPNSSGTFRTKYGQEITFGKRAVSSMVDTASVAKATIDRADIKRAKF